MKYSWVLFDADGTLFDFRAAARQAFRNTCEQVLNRFEAKFVPVYERINQQAWQDLEASRISAEQLRTRRFDLFFDAVGVQADAEQFSERYLANLAGHSDLIDGAEEIVRRLAPHVGLVLITNGLREVQRPRFARAPITSHFQEIIISEEVGAAKPAAAIFDETFRRLSQPNRSEVLIVGDSLTSDIRGGNDYGIDTCWYNPEQLPRRYEIPSQFEIACLADLAGIVGV